MAKKKTLPSEVVSSEAYVKDFFDMVVPSTIKFNVDHFVCGDSFRCVWAIKEYPPNTTDQAILSRFGDKEAVTLHMYTRFVDGLEQRKILQNASRKNKMLANSNDLEDSVMGEGNLYDVVELMNDLRKNREPLLHCAVFVELSANSLDKLKELQADISMEMTREKLSVDRLTLRQKEGFIACMPCGHNVFGTQFERVLPASAVANCYPFNYSGKTDPHGFYIGRDKFGTNIIVDFDRRSDDKTNSNILILGNSGQGKSYLLKLILTNTRMSGKSVLCLDAEQEYKDLTNNLGGCYVDLTNITDDKFICFGVKGLMDANKKLKDAMLFNILSFMNHKLLTKGHTAASIDELYLFLTNLTAIEYIRNASKRVRKKESSIILASQNTWDVFFP